MEQYILIGILCSLLLSAFFSGMEIAIVSSSRLELELDVKKKAFLANIISKLFKKSWRVVGVMLVGNNIALVMYGLYMTKYLDPYILPYVQNNGLVLFLETLISTIIVLFLAEFLPKTIFRLNPNRALNFFKVPFLLSYYLLYIPSIFIINLSERFLKIFMKVHVKDETFNFGIVDLNDYLAKVSERESDIQEIDNEFHFLKNALEFSTTKARECMIPRTEIQAVDIEDNTEKLLKLFIDTGLSRVMVFRHNIDNIIGYVHSSRMFEKPELIREFLSPVLIVPESMTANDIMRKFISGRNNVAVVVDEFGGTSGIITREDLLEEIFGEIEDEYDTEDLIEKKIKDNLYEFSARLEIDSLNDNYSLEIPESGDYETLAGYILHHTESIPEVGQILHIDHFQFEIIKVAENKIELVKFKILSKN